MALENRGTRWWVFLLSALFWLPAACAPEMDRASATRLGEATAVSPIPTFAATATAVSPAPTTTPAHRRGAGEEAFVTVTPRTPPLRPTPGIDPDFDAAGTRADLRRAIAIRPANNETPHPLIHVGGWPDGFRSAGYCHGPFRWLDADHLLLFPLVGYTNWFEDPTGGEVTLPLVVDLREEMAPWTTAVATDRCKLPVYSAVLNRLIDVNEGQVQLFRLDGTPEQTYPGGMPLALAPSGLRLLAEHTWIDLASGETAPLDAAPDDRYLWNPRWSADETRLAECCLTYVDAETGEWQWPNQIQDIFFGGIGVGPGWLPDQSDAHWVMDEQFLLFESQASFIQGGRYNPIPLIDPVSKTYEDIRPRLGLDDENQSCFIDVAPTSQFGVIGCNTILENESRPPGEHLLVSLTPLTTVTTLPGALTFVAWSPDGRFYLYWDNDDQSLWLAAVEGGPARQISDEPIWAYDWSPTSQVLAYWTAQSEKIHLFDMVTGETHSLSFPHAVERFVWSHQGTMAAVLTGDGRLWHVRLQPEMTQTPLTGPTPGVASIAWSPDDGKIAFAGEGGVYVVLLTDIDS